MTNNNRDILIHNLKIRGEKTQIIKTCEEMSELQTALLHYCNGKDSVKHVTEEIADVLVMIEQLKIIFNVSEKEVEEIMEYKILREKTRIDGEHKR